jgi:membrane-associated phospholipid phosphatase
MTKETYEKMTQPFRDHPDMAKSLHRANRILEGIVSVSYLLLLAWLLWRRDARLFQTIAVPLDGFIAVSVLRRLVNRPRPYEKFKMSPVIPKDTKGKSFPSRHVFSAAIIALSFFFVPEVWGVGVLLLVCAALLALLRVLSGVHYPGDVIAGFVAAGLCAGAAWFLF